MIEAHESTTAKLCSFARAYHSAYARKKIFDDSLALLRTLMTCWQIWRRPFRQTRNNYGLF